MLRGTRSRNYRNKESCPEMVLYSGQPESETERAVRRKVKKGNCVYVHGTQPPRKPNVQLKRKKRRRGREGGRDFVRETTRRDRAGRYSGEKKCINIKRRQWFYFSHSAPFSLHASHFKPPPLPPRLWLTTTQGSFFFRLSFCSRELRVYT